MDIEELEGKEVEIMDSSDGVILIGEGSNVYKIVGEFKVEEIKL